MYLLSRGFGRLLSGPRLNPLAHFNLALTLSYAAMQPLKDACGGHTLAKPSIGMIPGLCCNAASAPAQASRTPGPSGPVTSQGAERNGKEIWQKDRDSCGQGTDAAACAGLAHGAGRRGRYAAWV